MSDYAEFLAGKRLIDPATGLAEVPPLHPALFPFQHDITAWALRRGRAAIFADCGMGKTPMQIEWANHVPGRVLILAPLAVAAQTVREGIKFSIPVEYARSQAQAKGRIIVANYEMLEHFDPAAFDGVVLDESSILKSYDGKTRTAIIEAFAKTPFRLACTATPAPNDYMELGNHAEFLGVMSRVEMLSMFFVHDGGETQKWRLKGHAESEFWKWLCSWAVMIRKPSDLGYEDGAFTLPEMVMHQSTVKIDKPTEGYLFPLEAQSLQDRLAARRSTITERVSDCAAVVNSCERPFLVWCNLNSESEALTRSIQGAVEVKGADSNDAKEKAMLGFADGSIRVLVTKPSIAGFGMNWQHCADMAFVGLSDSYEQFYQAVRRCWRFGQQSTVNVHIITAETAGTRRPHAAAHGRGANVRVGMRQRGFTLLVYAVLALAILGTLTGIAWKIRESGKESVRLEWAEANRAAEAEATRLRIEREAEGRKAIIALHNAEKEARNATERWKQARQALGRTPLAVCPAPQPAAPDAATGTVASREPDPGAGLRLTFAFSLLYDRAWTDSAGKPVFPDPGVPAAGTPAPGAASPAGLDRLLDVHAENANRCSSNSRQLATLIALLRRLRNH